MKIAHVVNLVDAAGTYGGPLRVALNQLAELQARGHAVELLGGAPDVPAGHGIEEFQGVPTRRFTSAAMLPRPGFAGRWAPGLQAHVLRHGRQYDVVHVHLSRDLTTLPAAAVLARLRVPYVVQTHGMIDPSRAASAVVLDKLLTRPVLRRARAVLHLTATERHNLDTVVKGASWAAVELPNGVPSSAAYVVGTGVPEVLFLSRLQARKRPLVFVAAARLLAEEGVRARFTVIGPDEGMLPDVLAALDDLPDTVNAGYEGALPMSGTVARIGQARVFVLPSLDEPFPMVVLEAMSVGVPVVCTQSCGLAGPIEAAGAGMVVPDGDPHAVAEAVRRLLDDPALARRCGCAGLRLVRERFTARVVADRLEQVYREAAAVPSPVAGLVGPG